MERDFERTREGHEASARIPDKAPPGTDTPAQDQDQTSSETSQAVSKADEFRGMSRRWDDRRAWLAEQDDDTLIATLTDLEGTADSRNLKDVEDLSTLKSEVASRALQRELEASGIDTHGLDRATIQKHMKNSDNTTLQRRLNEHAAAGESDSPEALFIKEEIARRNEVAQQSLTPEPDSGTVDVAPDPNDEEIAKGFAGQEVTPTDELRRLYADRESAIQRLDEVRNDDKSTIREQRDAQKAYRDASNAYNAELVSEIAKGLPEQKEQTDDGSTSDRGTGESIPDSDGVPGRPESEGTEVPEEPGDGREGGGGDRSRVRLNGKELK